MEYVRFPLICLYTELGHMPIFVLITGKGNQATFRLIASNLNLGMGQTTLKSNDALGSLDILNIFCIREKEEGNGCWQPTNCL